MNSLHCQPNAPVEAFEIPKVVRIVVSDKPVEYSFDDKEDGGGDNDWCPKH